MDDLTYIRHPEQTIHGDKAELCLARTRGMRLGRERELLLAGTVFQFCKKKVLEMDGGDGCTAK